MAAEDLGPVWSPDGTQIAFFTDRNHRNDCFGFEIATMNRDGSGVRILTPHSSAQVCRPQLGALLDKDPAWR